jgi:hypothetical protein
MDRKDFELSKTDRIKFVRDSLAIWMKNNGIELFEIKRAIAMLYREEDDAKKTRAMK